MGEPGPTSRMRLTRAQRFGLVLVFITASFAVQGTISESGWHQAIVAGLLCATLLLTFWAAEMPARRFRVARPSSQRWAPPRS